MDGAVEHVAASPAARLFALAGALASGILLAEAARPPWPACGLIAAAGLTVAAALRRRPVRAVATLAAAAALGVCVAGLRLASLDAAALRTAAGEAADALLTGEVLGDARDEAGATRFLLGVRAAEIDGRPFALRERAWVSVRPLLRRRPRGGDLVRVDARLAPLARAAAFLERQGVAARAYSRPGGVEPAGRTGNPIARAAAAARRAVERAAARLPPRERGLLLGVTIGDTSGIDPLTDLDFRTTGLTHLLAVSGANVAMFLGALAFLLRLARAGRRLALAVLAVALLGFMATTRFEPSVLRAGAMAGIGLAGMALGARREALTALGAAALGLLVYDPLLVRSIGFQLSAIATLGILVLSPRLAAVLPRGKLGGAAAVTLGAQLAVGPLIALHFHQVSLIALASNLLALPAVAPATVVGLAAAALGALWAPLAAAVHLAQPALAWMAWVARALAQVPGAAVGTPGGALGLAAVGLLVAAAIGAARMRRAAPAALGLALVLLGATLARSAVPAAPEGLSLTALDVGQGDALLVRAPGAVMLVDGGPDPGLLLRKLRDEGVRRVDLLVLTHPHADHVDGLVPVAERYPVGRALDSRFQDDTPSYRAYERAIARRGIPRDEARPGLAYRLGPATVEVLGPRERFTGTDSDVNNNSVVLRVRYGAGALLLTGDVEVEAQEALLERPEALSATVLKVPHHGSNRMLPELYAATGARVAVISVGRGNDLRSPVACVLACARRRPHACLSHRRARRREHRARRTRSGRLPDRPARGGDCGIDCGP